MIKVLWVSRKKMTEEQKKDLEMFFNKEVAVIHTNHEWQMTDDEESDMKANEIAWEDLGQWSNIIAGVFPSVAFEAIPWHCSTKIITPVTIPLRDTNNRIIGHEHVRWATLKD